MMLLAASLLLLAALLSCYWILPWLRPSQAAHQPLAFCTLLALLLSAGHSLSLLLGSQEAILWFSQAGQLLGLPLLGAALLNIGYPPCWARPTWGRLVLGLCVAFEFSRLLTATQLYTQLLGILVPLIVLWRFWCTPTLPHTLRVAGLGMAGLLGLRVFPVGEVLSLLILAGNLPLIAYLLHRCLQQQFAQPTDN